MLVLCKQVWAQLLLGLSQGLFKALRCSSGCISAFSGFLLSFLGFLLREGGEGSELPSSLAFFAFSKALAFSKAFAFSKALQGSGCSVALPGAGRGAFLIIELLKLSQVLISLLLLTHLPLLVPFCSGDLFQDLVSLLPHFGSLFQVSSFSKDSP